MRRATAVRLHQRLAAVANGPGYFSTGHLPAVVDALIGIHAPQASRSINTLGCDEHNVTKGPSAFRHLQDGDYDACPNCVVTPLTVCASWGCEEYPCETIRAVAKVLGIGEEAELR